LGEGKLRECVACRLTLKEEYLSEFSKPKDNGKIKEYWKKE
jgi:hypothetical protein